MATIISTKTSGVGGLEVTGDATGILQLASNNGTTAVTVDATQNIGIGSTPPSTPSQYGVFLGAPAVIQTPTSAQFSVADNAYFNGTIWKARTTQNGYAAIRYNASGNGDISIHANSASYTAGDTLTQMDGTDNNFILSPDGLLRLNKSTGAIINSSGRKILGQTGSILQVVSATTATEVTSSSGTYVDTGLTATITPSSTSSRILVIVQQVGCGKLNDVTLQLKLLRNTTDLMWLERSGGWTAAGGRNFFGTCGCSFIDSPATTSAVTYKTQMAAFSPAAIVYTQFNVGAGNPTSTITLLEIAG